jgi:2-polyprenyl-6-methoxyphenol hydroxylase-like FAD-dependent oxidoreductase
VTEPSVLIAGAGLAGLAMARALTARGRSFDIVERGATEPGAGIFLPANAVRALAALGVTGVGHPIVRHRLLNRAGRTLVDLPFTAIWGETGRCLAARRSDLHKALSAGITVRQGVRVRGAHDGLVEFDDHTTRPYDLVVAADGIHSTLRAGPPPRPTGLVAWRFLASGVPDHEWTAWQDRDRTFLAISLGDGAAYCYADASHGAAGDWRDLFADFPDPVPALARQGGDAHHAPIEQVGPAYSDDPRTVLIGDAAHANSPNMAQGAALAFEDALVLAEVIEAGDIGSYRDRRLPRVTWVRDQSRRRDRARHLPPLLRDAVLRLAGPRMIKAQFGPLRSGW